jgi:phospholipase C
MLRICRHFALAAVVVAALAAIPAAQAGDTTSGGSDRIRHIVVIFQENVSFDHYFGTYPVAANPPGQPEFHAATGTPRPVNLLGSALATHNPNEANPQRLNRSDWPLCDLSHDYDPELREWNGGKMNRFVQESVDYERSDRPGPGYGSLPAGVTGGVTDPSCAKPIPGHESDQATNKETMDYYDGNTVTALWNYAQHGVLFDQAFDPTFGPSTPGALNLISGQTGGVVVPPGSDDQHPCTDLHWALDLVKDCYAPSGTRTLFNGDTDLRDGVVIGDPDPAFDNCASTNVVQMEGRNIGDLLNAHGATWGFFEGGFRPTVPARGNDKAVCGARHRVINRVNGLKGSEKTDYSAHHEPFQYYKSTANPKHLPPSSVKMIGRTDQANHQYDLSDFRAALKRGLLPAVSFLKAPRYEDGHAGYSDPLDEQRFLVETINAIERSPEWRSTAIFIAYDDSDGFYDQVSPPILNFDSATIPGPVVGGVQWPGNMCQPAPDAPNPSISPIPDRCGYGPRLPMLVISPWVKPNALDSTTISTDTILRFIEDRFAGGERISSGSLDNIAGSLAGVFSATRPHLDPLILNSNTGEPVRR